MQSLTEEYIPAVVASCEDMKDGDSVSEETISALISLKEFVDHHYARPEGMYSKVRFMLALQIPNADVKHQARQIIKQNRKDYVTTQKKAEAVVARKNSHQTVLSMSYIWEVVTMLKLSSTFSDNVILLKLACGARKIEILDEDTSSFFGHDDLERRITQVGMAKKRPGCKIESITKPLLFLTPSDFLEKLRGVRLYVLGRSKENRVAMGKTVSHQLELLCHKQWPQNVDNGYRTGTHINRAIYANIAYKRHGKPGESLTHFIKHQLGHDSMGSAANYMNVSISFNEDSALAEEADRQAMATEDSKITLMDENGHLREFMKPPVRRMDPEDREELARTLAEKLRISSVPVTRGNLMALGVQSKIVTSSGAIQQFQ